MRCSFDRCVQFKWILGRKKRAWAAIITEKNVLVVHHSLTAHKNACSQIFVSHVRSLAIVQQCFASPKIWSGNSSDIH